MTIGVRLKAITGRRLVFCFGPDHGRQKIWARAEDAAGDLGRDKTVRSYGVTGKVTAIRQFGYLVLRDHAGQWEAALQDVEGHQIVACTVAGAAKADGAAGGACARP